MNTTGASQGLLDGGHVLSSITLHSQEVQGAARVLGTQVQFRVYAYWLLSEAAVLQAGVPTSRGTGVTAIMSVPVSMKPPQCTWHGHE